MGSVDENRSHWEAYDWSGGGEEWSEVWGGSAVQWEGAILPRIRPFLPAGEVLEIASGAGRWSVHLRRFARRLTLVDLSEPAIAACRTKFAGDPNVRCFRNDGRDLSMVGDRTVDFVFSFDSLVHCELPELEGYLAELSAKLAPEGVGFFHHSNFGAVLAARPGSKNLLWRAESVCAEGFVEACRAAGSRLHLAGDRRLGWGRSRRLPLGLHPPGLEMGARARPGRESELHGRGDESAAAGLAPARREPLANRRRCRGGSVARAGPATSVPL